jgi:hypothetical protein
MSAQRTAMGVITGKADSAWGGIHRFNENLNENKNQEQCCKIEP